MEFTDVWVMSCTDCLTSVYFCLNQVNEFSRSQQTPTLNSTLKNEAELLETIQQLESDKKFLEGRLEDQSISLSQLESQLKVCESDRTSLQALQKELNAAYQKVAQ